MKTFALAAMAAIVALVMGFGAQLTATSTAHAEVTGSVAIGCEFLARYIDGDAADVTIPADVAAACDGITPAEVVSLAATLGDKDATLEASDFTAIDLDANQIEEGTLPAALAFKNYTLIFAFVDDDAPVVFDAPTGLVSTDSTGAAWATTETCTTEDLDCSLPQDGDGVVVARIADDATVVSKDTSLTVNLAQEGSEIDSSQVINVTALPHDVTMTATKTTLQSSGTSTLATACNNASDLSDAAAQAGEPNRTLLKAVITDAAGTAMTRAGVVFSSDATTKADFDEDDPTEAASDPKSYTSESVDPGAAGIAAFAIICGGSSTGAANVKATIDPNGVPGDSDDDSSTVALTVVGVPAAIALTASPATVLCDGVNTSTVTAKVTDSAGNNVADGTKVVFSVVALGTANPINATTTAGSASSTITPLSTATQGVTVTVSSGDVTSQIRVDCTPTGASTTSPTATPTGGTTGTIVPPNTGTGGYLDQNSASFPMWTLIALALGSFALIGGGIAVRRSR